MSRGSRVAAADLDPELLIAAAHEVGHAVLAHAYGITVVSIQVDRTAYTGMTVRDLDRFPPGVLRAALIGDLAGFEAERLWCARHGGHADRARSATDFAQVATYRRRAGLIAAEARRQARLVLRRHWSTVERLAPRLARHGEVAPW